MSAAPLHSAPSFAIREQQWSDGLEKGIFLDVVVKMFRCRVDAIGTVIRDSENDLKSLYEQFKREVVILVKYDLLKCRALEGSPKALEKYVRKIVHFSATVLLELSIFSYCFHYHTDASTKLSRRSI